MQRPDQRYAFDVTDVLEGLGEKRRKTRDESHPGASGYGRCFFERYELGRRSIFASNQ